MSSTQASTAQIDPRGPRFGAWITSAVLAVVLLVSGSPLVAAALLTGQAVVFALGTRGSSPYQAVFRTYVRPRLVPPTELEDAAPPRFAQVVGFAFAAVGAVGFWTGATVVGQVFTGFALVAALLNASVGLCLGCELYLIFKRSTTKGATA